MAGPLPAWLIAGTSSQNKLVEERRVKGYLEGYVRRAVLGVDFPAITKGDEDDKVKGFIFYPRNGDDLHRIDVFEGDLYREEKVTVVTSGHVPVEATCTFGTVTKKGLGDTDWSFEEYESTRLEDWLDLMEGMEII